MLLLASLLFAATTGVATLANPYEIPVCSDEAQKALNFTLPRIEHAYTIRENRFQSLLRAQKQLVSGIKYTLALWYENPGTCVHAEVNNSAGAWSLTLTEFSEAQNRSSCYKFEALGAIGAPHTISKSSPEAEAALKFSLKQIYEVYGLSSHYFKALLKAERQLVSGLKYDLVLWYETPSHQLCGFAEVNHSGASWILLRVDFTTTASNRAQCQSLNVGFQN